MTLLPRIDATGIPPDPACPACGNTPCIAVGALPPRAFFAGRQLDVPIAGGGLFRCQACALAFRWPVLSDDRYLALYDNGCDSHWLENETRMDFRLLAKELNSRLPQGGAVLDIGCNTGDFLASLDSRYALNGIEINSTSAARARDRGIAVWRTLREIPHGAHFDAITAIDIIEHVKDPRAFIAELVPLLKPHGALLISTGNADNAIWRLARSRWWYCAIPEHISFISKTWCAHHAKNLGLELVTTHTFGYVQLPALRFALDGILALLYSIAPQLYLRSMKCLMHLLGKSGDPPIRGIGLTRDHILVVLRPLNHGDDHTEPSASN